MIARSLKISKRLIYSVGRALASDAAIEDGAGHRRKEDARMPKVKLIALTTPLPGKEAEFHDWYQNTHLQEVTSVPGFEGAQRFQLVAKLAGSDPNTYLAIYDADVDDPAKLLAGMGELAQSGKMTPPSFQDMATTYTALFTECGDYVKANN
jgi:hypothetical protein